MLTTPKQKFVWVSQGTLPPCAMLRVALMVIQAAGMTPARRARVDRYPYGGSWWRHLLYLLGFQQRAGGGRGYTMFQPLMESYLMVDVYTDNNETEILLSTCKPERTDLNRIKQLLVKNLGPTERIA